MNSKIFNKIIQIDKEFYNKNGESFSSTRMHPWERWDDIINYINSIKEKKNYTIIDIGCGNGRLLKYLISTNFNNGNFNYTGLDTSKKLIEEAENLKYSKKVLKNIDVIFDLEKIEESYDLVFIFGLSHHIPSKAFRKEWFKNVLKLVNQDGILVVSFWNLCDSEIKRKLYDRSFKKYEDIINEFEENDYLLKWADSIYPRYYHKYSDKELKILFKRTNILKEYNLLEDDNLYLILQSNK